MKTTVDMHDFRESFRRMGRGDQFSYQGLGVLFEYLEQWEEDSGEELELDVIALCCDFYEDTAESIAEDYSIDLSDCENDEEREDVVRDYLSENGAYIGDVAGGFVYRAF